MSVTSSRAARLATAAIVLVGLWTAPGCSVRKFAITRVANALTAGSSVWARDDDPELVRDAVPFALKTFESLLETVPEHRPLLLSSCSGFTQYAYAFVETDAELIESESYREARRLRERALKLYLRGRDYCLRSLELRCPGIGERILLEPEPAVAACRERDVELLYWTGAAWGSAVSLGKDRPEIVADLPAVTALMRRALELDEDYGDGAIHEVLVVLESLGSNLGGSVERAREHYRRAVELSGGRRASTHLALAESVAVPQQDRTEFTHLLELALAVDPDGDPDSRLQNVIVQRRARHLLERADELFFEELPAGSGGD